MGGKKELNRMASYNSSSAIQFSGSLLETKYFTVAAKLKDGQRAQGVCLFVCLPQLFWSTLVNCEALKMFFGLYQHLGM